MVESETSQVELLRAEAAWFAHHREAIADTARTLIQGVRESARISPAASFQKEYGLSSEEGILLMCLAEALLRIPDRATADALIRDKLSPGQWNAHIGLGRPWFVNWAGHGLDLAGKVADEARLGQSAGEFLGALIHRLGEPVVRAALRHSMRLMGEVFVMGEDMPHALREARPWRKEGYTFSFDMLGEGARNKTQADEYFERYRHAIRALGKQEAGDISTCDGISIKLSALHPRLELRQWERLEKELLPRLETLVREAAAAAVPLTIDAEEATRLDVTLRVFSALRERPFLSEYAGLGLAVQAYNRRALWALKQVKSLAERTQQTIAVRLVKGAYWDAEIKRAQMEGLADYPVFTRKAHTDISYLACAEFLLRHPSLFYPQFATHNALTVAAILHRARGMKYEFQRLHGMGEALHHEVRHTHGVPCRIYAPVGITRDLLSYLIRRILENGANASFVHSLADDAIPMETLIADPFEQVAAPGVAAPSSMFGTRENSRGYDLGDAATLEHWRRILQAAAPLPEPPPEADVEHAYLRAKKAFPAWAGTPVEARATLLERTAQLLEEQQEEIVALCVGEAGKTLADAIAELREAVDYCRYYAQEARRVLTPQLLPGPTGEKNVLTLHPRGVVVAISPWNFPLAIFMGQVTAALAAGNCVLAKPAEQTPRIAAYAVELLHQAGMDNGIVQLVPGRGESVGSALVTHPDCAAVVFTGSTETAHHIHRSLAASEGAIVPLIAETGGQNCMVVDSSALIEQTVDDMVTSAFFSAGQRCSALRVAFVQEDIADALYATLAGAMQELTLGDPHDPATDIGPVIDEDAAGRLHAHIARMKQEATFIAATPGAGEPGGRFVAPHAFEISHIGVLQGEVFGPILHLIRFRSDRLEDVIAQINSTGYGLTFGIQSRIDATIQRLSSRVVAGNIYVNRSMTGAVVGVQPFGGSGLSGTGPKAGGPRYLQRFCQERTLTTNTAAIGGNIELLSRKE